MTSPIFTRVSGIEFFMEDCQGKRFKGTSRHCQVGSVVGRAVSGNIVIAVELPGHTSVVNTTVCQTWCQTCGEVVVSCLANYHFY